LLILGGDEKSWGAEKKKLIMEHILELGTHLLYYYIGSISFKYLGLSMGVNPKSMAYLGAVYRNVKPYWDLGKIGM
jgi:hypothetical protein